MSERRKLSVYFGERDRVGGAFLADRILGVFAQRGLRASVLLRGAEGFGIKHHRRTDRLLSLSEDLPLIALGVDAPDAIDGALSEIGRLGFDGLVTVERAAELTGEGLAASRGDVKLTAYLGRGARHGGRPAHEAATARLHSAGVAGATVLVGVDGTLSGERRRARFFSRNTGTPCVLVSVGSADAMERAAAALASDAPPGLVVTRERVNVLKRDGSRIGELPAVPPDDEGGLARWTKLTLYSGEQNHFGGRPVHIEAVERLRRAGAPGATAIRGVWGYHGDHEPHGDTVWTVRRRVPTVTVVVDRPAESARWLAILDEITPRAGLITSEVVPAFQARAGDTVKGGVALADPLP